ncbi:unnamed protein product [Effrenium voratum]|nr:unnamed protein product [Effrenium voratum]
MPGQCVDTCLEEGSASLSERSSEDINNIVNSPESDLIVDLEPNLVKGVPLQVSLSGWGRHWVAPDSGMFNVDPANYELSQVVEAYDAFLSHEWASSRWLKLFTLLMVFNSGPAFWACLFVSLAVGLGRACEVLPNELWTAALGHLTFFVVFAFYQRIRLLFARPLMVFLDKLCIAQHDEELKSKGILGLPTFLLKSKKLLVLWTPRYCSRLWCALEMATFMKDPKYHDSIEIVPLKTTIILAAEGLAWSIMSVGYNMMESAIAAQAEQEAQPNHTENVITVVTLMMLFGTAIVPVVFYVGLGLIAEVEELPRQLAEFRVQDCQCFCCTNNHKHPNTGEELPCDRELVFRSLKGWYPQPEQDHLDFFNSTVRSNLAPRVAAGTAGGVLPARYTLYMVGACNLPFLSRLFPAWAGHVHNGIVGYKLVALVLRSSMSWMIVGLAAVGTTRVSMHLFRLGNYLSRVCLKSRLCWVALLTPLSFQVATLLWTPYEVVKVMTPKDSMLPVMPFLAALAVVVYLLAFPGLTQKGAAS